MNVSRKLVLIMCCSLISMVLVSCSTSNSSSNTAVKSTTNSALAVSEKSYSEQAVFIDNGDYKVPGILVKPKSIAGTKIPVLVLLHGTASQKNEVGGLYQRLAQDLAEAGYASLRIDFAGTGDSPVDYRFYNLTGAARDTKSALDFLAAQTDIDSSRMGLVGFSQGGLIAQLVAAKDTRIKSLVAWSSVAGNGIGAFQFFFDEYYKEAKANGFAVVKFPWRAEPLNFGLQWFDEISKNTSLDGMKNYHGNLLAIAGSADTLVPYSSSVNLVNAVNSKQAQFTLIKNADHMFNVLGSSNANGLAEDQSTAEELLVLTVSWVGRNL